MSYLMRSTLNLVTARLLLPKIRGNGVAHIQPVSTSFIALWQKHNTAHAGGGSDGETKPNSPKKSKESGVKITLIQNDNITVTALEDARNLAKRRSMHLVQVEKMDTKTQRPVYKLLTSAERLQEELADLSTSQEKSADKANQKKTVKNLNIGSRISDNDLASRLKNISKWLTKSHEVRILIQGNEKDAANCEKVFKAIEDSVKSPTIIGKVVQKRVKGAVIKFNILSVQTASNDKTSPLSSSQ